MDEVSERCVLLKNLPSSCNEKNLSEILDLAHGDFRFQDKYEKIHKHVELQDDIRWIILFRTRKDAAECIRLGEWECSLPGGSCMVKPDYCSGCIIPDEWLQNTTASNHGEERWTVYNDDDLEEGALRSEDLFTSFVVVKKEDAIMETTCTSAIPGREVRTSDSETVKYENKFDDLLTGFGPSGNENGDMEDEKAKTSGSRNSSFSESNVSSSELFGSGTRKKDQIKQFSDSVRSADMFGSGNNGFESLQFSYNKEIDENADEEDNVRLKRHHARIKADSIENPELFGSDVKTSSMSVMSMEMFGSGRNEKKNPYNVKAEKEETTEMNDIINQNLTEANVCSNEKSDSDAMDNTKQQIKTSESEGENITRRSAQNDSFATEHDLEHKNQNDNQTKDGIKSQDHQQINTVPKPEDNSSRTQHDQTYSSSSYKIETRNTSPNDPTFPVNDRNSTIQGCKVIEKNDAKVANINDFRSPDNHGSRYDRSSLKYDAPPIQRMHVNTSSTESRSASQTPNLNDAQNRAYDVPQSLGYPQIPGYFNTAVYPGHPPLGVQPYMPYNFNPNDNYQFPHPGYQGMHPIPQFPGLYPTPYPMVPPGFQTHGAMPPVYYVPVYMQHPGAMPSVLTVNNPEYSKISEESTSGAAFEKENKNSQRSQAELPKPKDQDVECMKDLSMKFDEENRSKHDSPDDMPKPVVQRQSSRNKYIEDELVYDTPYASKPETSVTLPGINDTNRPEHDNPKKVEMETINANELKKQEQHISKVTDTIYLRKNWKDFDGNRSEHIYHEIDNIDETLNDDDEVQNRANKVDMSTEEVKMPGKRPSENRGSGRALPPIPLAPSSDYSTVAKKRQTSDSRSPLQNGDEEDENDVNEDEKESGQRITGGNNKILVKGLSDEITQEALELYFEAPRIGGGDIEFSEIDGKKRQAIIEYKSEIDAREVIKRATSGQKFHMLNCDLEVLEYVAPKMDPLKVLVHGIAETTTDECIVNFIEGRCKLYSKVIRGETPGTAMLCFVKPPDLQQLRKMCSDRKCEGKFWKILPVEQTRSIQVTGLNPEISKDSVSLYFENKRRSDGGEVEQVVFREENKDCIVTFMQAEDAERTCKKEHVLDGLTIEVRLFYACLDMDEEYVVKLPAPITFEYLDDSIRKFLQRSPKYRSLIENGISSYYGQVVWEYKSGDNTCIQIECIVDPKDKHGLEKVKHWTENCTQIVNDVCDVVTVQRSHNIAVELWPELKSRLREISVHDPQEVAVILADNECVVVVVGEGENVLNVYKQIEKIVDEIDEKMKKENQEITKKVHFKKYEMALVRAARLDTRFKKDQVELSIDRDGTEIVFRGKQKDVDDALAKLKNMMKSFVSRTVPGFTREAKDLLFRKEARGFIKAKLNKEKIIGVWDVPRGSEVIMHSRNMKDLDKAVQILKESLKIDSIQLDPVKAGVFRSGAGVKKLNDLKGSHEGLFLYSLQQPEDEIHFACVEHLHSDIKSEIISFIDLNTIISQFVPTDIGTFSFIIQYKQKELDSIVKQFSRLAVSLTTVDKEQSPGFTVKGKKDGCRLAIIQLQQVIESVVHKDLKLPWPGFDKFVRSKEGSDEMKLIELNEKCVIKVFEDSTSNRRSQSEDSSSYKGTKTQNTDPPRHSENDSSASGIKKGIKKNVIPGSLAAEKADVIVNSTNSDLDMKVGAISRTLLKAGGDQLGLECKTKYPDGIKLGEIAVTTGGALNCKSLFHGVLTRWDGGQGQAERVMTHFIKECLKRAHKHKFESISFPALGTGMLGFPANVVAQIMNDVVDGFGVDNPNTSLKCVNFVIWHEDKATSKAFEDYTVNRGNIIRSRDGSSKKISAMAAENIIVQGGNLQTTIDKVSISVEQGDITKTFVGAIVNSTMNDLNLNSGAISKAILLAAGSSIQREATAKKYKFDADGLVVTSQGQLTMCQKIIHIRARNGLNGWTSTIQDCLVETENLGLNSVAFPALGTGGKGVSADQMAKTMIEAFQDFIKSSKYKGSLRTIRVVIFDRKMLDTFVTVIKTALDPQQKKGLLHDFKFWERKSNVETAPITTVHIYAGSSHYLDRAVSKIEDVRREKDLFVISIVRENFKESNAKDLQRIGYNNRVKVVVSSGCIKVMGYGKAADAAIREAQMYLKDLETDIRKILLPLSWKGMNITDRTTVVGLPVHDLEYVKVAQRFSSECSFPHLKPNILTIERIQNPTLYTQFVGKKRQMEIINKAGRPVGRQLWHGTRTKEAVNNIIQKGFDRNYNSGSSYGVGVYFAVNAQMSLGYCSPDATGQQYILLADVLTGEYGQGSGGIRVPPNRPDGLTYDSTTDNVAAPSLFVIYHDAQAYPTYVITFR